ncbi:gelsolin-like protein 2 isoform X2 [Gigantopelta aegis]|uniref:gelsolin-like protein 2 isoform X2 n=1 Tax=Gigantopelta aegis TaxID=1735272 RepID=UPI001B888804|nr:gelsolin-like protein 2 isoform X2 [Gigantopelta aegis]
MAGLIKAKEYDWKDSNLEMFGSDLDRNVKKDSAKTEPAWKHAGEKPGIQVWRIVKFKVRDWPQQDYGKFFNGDSYIVLNTYKEEGTEQLLYDVHFWIGKHSTQDEYGTAAYKTVELDTLLDDVPVQHREVQGHESALFKSYFPTITILEGGADSGFRHVKPEEYKPRLFHFHGDRKHVDVKEVPRAKSRLDKTDVFILDLGLRIIQWNGSGSNKDERFRASQYMRGLADERNGRAKTEVVDEDGTDSDAEFCKFLTEEDREDTDKQYEAADLSKQLFRLSDESGKLQFFLEKEGSVTKGDFDSKDVFIYDTKQELFVWIGKQTSSTEKKNAMAYAHKYLMKSDHPLVPVSCLKEDRPSREFISALAA